MYCENPYNSLKSVEPEWGGLMNRPSWNLSGFRESSKNNSSMKEQSLVLDGDKGELIVRDSGRLGKKVAVPETKALAALKSHSEAERRRRDRINAHFVTLRGLVPSSDKMDKATLLAEVISQLKQLRTTASRATEGLHIPMDTDEVKVEKLENNVGHASLLLRASICCEHKPNLLSELRRAINDLPVKVLKCEISTFAGRVKTVFLISSGEGNNDGELIVNSIRSSLSNILDKVSASAEFAEELFFPQKRRRLSYVDC